MLVHAPIPLSFHIAQYTKQVLALLTYVSLTNSFNGNLPYSAAMTPAASEQSTNYCCFVIGLLFIIFSTAASYTNKTTITIPILLLWL